MSIFYFENTPHGTRRDGSKLNTKLHFEYIAREGKFEKSRSRREDLVFLASGNLPEWAENASDFWEQAETHRRKNGRAYREFRIGLQEELTLEENKALIERFIEETGIKKNHVYSYAIHDKPAAFDSQHRNIHCHLMFSEKVLEADRLLSEDKFFKNYAENEAGEPTQGYRTETYWARKEATLELREKWAQLVNDKFKEKGLSCRIDHRTLDAQRHDLIEQGKLEEAVLLDRTPAPHLGNIYKNPAMMKKIQFAIEEAYRTADDAEAPADTTDERSPEDINIAVFANDFSLRKIAREIQQERLRIRAERENAQDDHEIAEILDNPYTVTVEDVEVTASQRDGYNCQSYGGVTVALSTTLTEALIEEGFVREIISKVQTMRKECGLEVTDHIALDLSGNPRLVEIARRNEAFIREITLADSLSCDAPMGTSKEWNINGEKLTLSIK